MILPVSSAAFEPEQKNSTNTDTFLLTGWIPKCRWEVQGYPLKWQKKNEKNMSKFCLLFASFLYEHMQWLSIYLYTDVVIFPSSPFKDKGLKWSFSMSHHTEMALAPPSISVLIGFLSYNKPGVHWIEWVPLDQSKHAPSRMKTSRGLHPAPDNQI